ncbi:MAG: diacylglycerol kinase [Treponema sp.]|nr:diacylglycerol kinase [Treponema sp.]
MNLGDFASALSDICSRCLVVPERPLDWTVIANPTAGGFTIRSRWKRHERILRDYTARAASNPRRSGAGPSRTALEQGGALGALGLIPTAGPGHAGKIVEALTGEAASDRSGRFHLIITAGGDGTSLEALIALYQAGAAVRSGFAILRLPMGTGNDGADAWELDKALDLLIYPSNIGYTRALRLTTSVQGKGPFLAFNILSVGIDAFITHMTNKTKGKLPGDSYKLWVDIASLLYDLVYKVGPMEVRALDGKGRETASFREPLLLLAVGISGRRTYGSHKWILPDDRNVCAVKQMSLLRKVALKGLFLSGKHINKPESKLFNASRVEFRGEYPILAQMDGEAVLLHPVDFPASIELTEPAIPILTRL